MTSTNILQHARRRLFDTLDGHPEGKGWTAYALHYGIVSLILINVGSLILESVPDLSARYGAFFHFIELLSVFLFTCEYLVRLWVITEDRSGRYKHPTWGRLRYMATPLAIIDLLAFLPFYLAVSYGLDFMFLRLFRVLRMLKLVRYSPALATLARVYRSESRSVTAALMVMLTTLTFSSTVLWMLENERQPEAFESIPDAMWWAMATLTTVGYGDIVPITPGGRIVGGVVMLLGIGMYTLPAAILATGFAQEIKRNDFLVSFDRIANIEIFKTLAATQISALTKALHTQIYPANYLILHRDDAPQALYIILEGEIRLSLTDHEEILGPGEFFGALAEFDIDMAYKAHIQTDTETRLLMLELKDFNHFLTQWPDLKKAIHTAHEERAANKKDMKS